MQMDLYRSTHEPHLGARSMTSAEDRAPPKIARFILIRRQHWIALRSRSSNATARCFCR